MGRAVGAAQSRLTKAERNKLHAALFARLLHEVKDGSLTDAEKALAMMSGDSLTDFLGAWAGDNRVSGGAGDGSCFRGSDTGE